MERGKLVHRDDISDRNHDIDLVYKGYRVQSFSYQVQFIIGNLSCLNSIWHNIRYHNSTVEPYKQGLSISGKF